MNTKQQIGVKNDENKLRIGLIPHEVIFGLAQVLTFGAKKYSPENFRIVPNGKSRYEDALLRHFYAYKSGEKYDPETGLSHLKHALANLGFLMCLEDEQENLKET